jgi:hypothetical protein
MFGWLKRKPKEQWRLVKTLEWGATLGKEKGKIFVHLYESDLGNRKWECGSTFNTFVGKEHELRSKLSGIEQYHTELTPWLAKRYVPGIPTYSDVDALDVQDKLSQP